ncbi:tyrosine-type recombinase/integrase [Synechococcus sp. CC9605]|uniref:tyrosine-type recombinase/integrase n=1 Tax=Synechococcus sp. (strain CC9605) TaxID=110662 RepID=UPI00005D5BAE|nr:tyrosine-type recombinase/integrase [Synechococcus sp. CC9605]ABB35417.1 hypothetical protein Syncc9605_1668 [Synechococcus sp. CC9605]
MTIVLDKLASEKAGINVFSGTLADLIDAYQRKQHERLSRGEIRNKPRITRTVNTWRKHFAVVFGPISEIKLSAMTDERWQEYVSYRGKQLKLSVLKDELKGIATLVRLHGMALGCPEIPDFDHVRVPKQEKSVRTETLTPDEYNELVNRLRNYLNPELGPDGFKRTWSLEDVFKPAGKKINQADEHLRRHQLFFLVQILASSGLRPTELCGKKLSSLRWRDIQETDVERDVLMAHNKKPSGFKQRAVVLSVRDETKTGRRAVPCLIGNLLDGLKNLTPDFTKPDDFVFCDRHGKPQSLKYLRFHMNDVVERWGFDRFDVTFYVLRHFYASEALKRGVSTVLVSRAMGTSTENIENVYGHIVMSEESMIRQLYSLD